VRSVLSLIAILGAGSVVAGSPDNAPTRVASTADAEFFESRVRPVLAKSCYGCHGPDQQQSSLRVDSREALLKGGARGPSIVPGDPEKSLLVKAIRHDGLKMPIGARLKDADISAVEDWIRKDAPWPVVAAAKGSSRKDHYAQLAREHWAFQPVRNVIAPEVKDSSWAKTSLDRFILSRLQQSKLSPAKPADKRILMRRLSYILTGLPPTAEEMDRFAADTAPDAYARLVDRVLASPRFGEHWARHWLDLVRFGETRGYEWNYEIVGAWRYRDYLIRALNGDVPYNQLVREHIAGDLLETPRINSKDGLNESLIGTAFYRLGEAGHDDCVMFREIALDVIDNQIDTLTKTFQGLTVSCARCHDHKLDPVPTEDYYGLYSILNSSRVVTHTLDLPQVNAHRIERMKGLKQGIRDEIAAVWKREAAKTTQYMLTSRSAAGDARVGGLNAARRESWAKALSLSGAAMDEPSYPWATLMCRTAANEKYLASEAMPLVDRYKREAIERRAFNRENFQQIASFSAKMPDGWTATGTSVTDGFASAGDFTIKPEGDQALQNVLVKGFYTNLLSGRLNGALRSPDLPKDRKFISVRVMGGNLGARRTVIDNCAIGENYKVFENGNFTWVKLDTFAKEKRLPVFVELVTRSDNPRLPDRPGVLKKDQEKLLDDPRSYFGIAAAVTHDVPETPRETLSHMLPLFERGIPSKWESLAKAYQTRIEAAVERWSNRTETEDDVRWLDWLLQNDLLPNQTDATLKLERLISEYRAIESEIPAPRVVEGLGDSGPGIEFPVLIGGNAKTYGDPAPRRFLKDILGDAPIAAAAGSGRRELAEMIASPENPLTARVMVNRIWQQIFGRGIVATVDNFGVIGDKPTHPELLEHLAGEFIAQGWSIKKMIRSMVLSETFRQSGEITAQAREVDPQNALLHHYPLRRLEAESIRDTLLNASGKLNSSLFGPSTDPYRDQPQEYRRLFSGPLDGKGRRSLYLKVTRMEGTRFLETFDYPAPMAARGNRDVTNVPAQALALLNDPFVLAEAEECARRLLSMPAESVDARVGQLFAMALGRQPNSVEYERFRGLASELASLQKVPREELPNNLTVWKDLAHTIFNMKEFIYIQ
jgi:mono/diheme cytochrome c family protein